MTLLQTINQERSTSHKYDNTRSKSSVKRWCNRYDGTWQSLLNKPHRPNSHPNRHTAKEERQIKKSFKNQNARYGWDGVYNDLLRKKYSRIFSGMVYAAKRLELTNKPKIQKKNKEQRRYQEILVPGEKIQIDVKEVPYNCLRGNVLRDGKHLYQWTAIDECTRMRFVYGFEEHTPENSSKFLLMVIRAFPFKIKTIQTDNGIEFTYKYISDDKICPFDKALTKLGINHKLIPPRTPWHNGKVERSHRNDQRYFYDWETFRNVDELNQKLVKHLTWSNNKPMRTIGRKGFQKTLYRTMIYFLTKMGHIYLQRRRNI